MDQLKKNPFWIGMGVLLLGAAVLYGWLIRTKLAKEYRDKNKALSTSIKALQDFAKRPVEEFPTEARLKRFKEEADALEQERRELVKYLRSLDDAALEKVFPALEAKLGPDGLPKAADFDVEHTREFDALKNEFAALSPADKSVFVYTQAKSPAEIKPAQKKFWIQQRFARACRAAGVKRIEEVAFGNVKKEAWGQVLSFRATVRVPFPDLPKLASELLRSDVVWRLARLEVVKAPIEMEKVEGLTKVDPEFREQTYFPADLILFHIDDAEKAQRYLARPEDLLPEPPVKVALALDVLDFDFPAEGSGGEGGQGADGGAKAAHDKTAAAGGGAKPDESW